MSVEQEYTYPVYSTQGGGLVRFVGNHAVFIVAPPWGSLGIGDYMPEEWDVIPDNDLARQGEDDGWNW